MPKPVQEIEVEVVAIDGTTPVDTQQSPLDQPQSDQTHPRTWPDWQQWQGKVRTLDRRWWPLWAALGILALALALTVGLVLGVVYVIVRSVVKLVRAILR